MVISSILIGVILIACFYFTKSIIKQATNTSKDIKLGEELQEWTKEIGNEWKEVRTIYRKKSDESEDGGYREYEFYFGQMNEYFGGVINKVNDGSIQFKNDEAKAEAIKYCEKQIMIGFQEWFKTYDRNDYLNRTTPEDDKRLIDDYMSRIENGNIAFATQSAKEAAIEYVESQREHLAEIRSRYVY